MRKKILGWESDEELQQRESKSLQETSGESPPLLTYYLSQGVGSRAHTQIEKEKSHRDANDHRILARTTREL